MKNLAKPVTLIHVLLYVFMLPFFHKRALAEENRPPNESYQIRYDDVIKVRLDIDRQDRYLASYEETYPYDIDSLSSACKGNVAEMHIVTAVDGGTGTEPNRYWRLLPRHGTKDGAQRGNPIKNGDIIRLQNVKTQRNLHAQGCPSIKSPLEMQISTCPHNGAGDVNADWKIEFNKSDSILKIGKGFILRHLTTGWILHAKNNLISERKGNWIEVAAHEQPLDSDSLPEFSLWHTEKRMLESANDSCASSERSVVSQKIQSLTEEIKKKFDSSYNKIMSTENKEFVFDKKKFNDALKSSMHDVTGSFFGEVAGALAVWKLAGEFSKKEPLKAVAVGLAVLTYKASIAAMDATSRRSTLGDELSAQREKYLTWLNIQRTRSTNYPLEGLQAVCVRLERNQLEDEEYENFVRDTVKLIKKSK